MHPLIPQENQGEKKYSEKFLFTQIPWGKKWPAIVIKYLLIRTTLKIFARINFQNDNNIFLLNVQFYQEDIFAQTRAQILKCAKIKPKITCSKEVRENIAITTKISYVIVQRILRVLKMNGFWVLEN